MAHLVEVAFKGNRKEFYRWSADDPPAVGAAVIVEGDRGEDLGRVHATGALAAKRYAGVAHGALALLGDGGDERTADVRGADQRQRVVDAPVDAAPTKRVLRTAAAEDVVRADELAPLDDEARRTAIARVRAHGLAMKLTDAEWQWDRRKLTLYFTAEKRVDFRALVRDLAAIFRARIELKQIGVRDEAKRLSGIGRCGREYCSATWLPELRPVNLTVAKDQRLSLNPTQISGACGRLMCSLRYEHEFYVQQRKRFPKEGRVLATARGEEKVIAADIFRERVTLRALDGETRVVPLDELRREVAAASEGAPPVAGEPSAAPNDGADAAVTAVVVTSADVTSVDERPSAGAPAETVVAAAIVEPSAELSVVDRDAAPDAGATPPAPESEEQTARRRGRRGGRRGRPNRDDA